MEALSQLFIIVTMIYGTIESIKLLLQKTVQLEHIGVFLIALIVFSATKTNLFLEFGITGEGNFFYNASYLLGALLTVQGAGWVHDIGNRINGKT